MYHNIRDLPPSQRSEEQGSDEIETTAIHTRPKKPN